MMKKTTSALAVAALLGTGAASAATFQVNDDTTLSISGDVEVTYTDTDGGTSADTQKIEDAGSEIKFSGEQASSNGLTTFFHTELGGFDITSNTGEVTTNDTRLGVKGDFGTVTFGDVNTAFDDVADIADILAGGGVTTGGSGANNQTLQYTSPDLNGFSFAVDTQLEASDDNVGGDKGAGSGNDAQDPESTVRLEYNLGAATLMAGVAQDETITGGGEKVAVGAVGNFNGIDLGIKFQQEDTSATDDQDLVALTAATSVASGIGVYGIVNNVSPSTGSSRTEIGLGGSYALADNFGLHAEQLMYDKADDADDYFEVGATLKF